MTPPTDLTLVHAYRNLLRLSLRAVQYAKPARYILRDRLRQAFRPPPSTQGQHGLVSLLQQQQQQQGQQEQDRDPHGHEPFSRTRYERTVAFLEGAGRESGVEHRLLKGLVWHWGQPGRRKGRRIMGKAGGHVGEDKGVVWGQVEGVVGEMARGLGMYL